MYARIFGALAIGAALAGCTTVADTPASSPSVEVHWIGHAAFKLTSASGKVILIDPFITGNPKLPAEAKNLDALGKVDLILVTHGHGDHTGDAVTLAKKHNAPVYAPAGLNQTLLNLGLLPANLVPRMNKTGVITPLGAGIRISMVRAEHSSEFVWKNPLTGKDETHVGGEPVGFVIEFENGFKIYHMGDTGLFGDMRLIHDYYRPDLIMIPIGGHFVMDPKAAAYATREMLKPRFAIPMHYGTIPVLKGTPAEYIQAMGDSPTKVLAWEQGQKMKF